MTAEVIYETIYQHLITKSFGQEIYADKVLCDKLRRSLPMMMNSMLMRQSTDLKIEIAYDVATKLDLSIAKLKPDAERRLCFEAGLVMLAYYQISNTGTGLYKTVGQLLQRYPELDVDPPMPTKELEALLLFRNVMVVALGLISASGSKNHLLDLVTRIAEGRSVKYITGSGERVATSCRVLIYRREGNVHATPKRPKQIAAGSVSGQRDGSVDDESVADSDAPTSTAAGKNAASSSSSVKAPRTAKKRSNHKVTDFAARIGKRAKNQSAPEDYADDNFDTISLPRVAEPAVVVTVPVDDIIHDQLSFGVTAGIAGSSSSSCSVPVMRGISSLYSDASMGYFGNLVGRGDEHVPYSTLDNFVGKPFPEAVALTPASQHASTSTSGGESVKPLAWYLPPSGSSTYAGSRGHSLEIGGGSFSYKRDHSLDVTAFATTRQHNSVDRQFSLETVDTPENDFFGRQFLSHPELFTNGNPADRSRHVPTVPASAAVASTTAAVPHFVGFDFSPAPTGATTLAATVDMFANVNTDAAASLVLLRSSSAT